ncbi:hypothetical protein BRADI_1g73090v3 [Brachypodium distachyon]|uniref:Cystatin domain-containing protein n=2 Tax=Brachypodium distachyon TaxID=15368 RepID=I1H966_BRADI|nr:hypothetical protein BRADI_1g73090v3 [Brachypodium distachyon]
MATLNRILFPFLLAAFFAIAHAEESYTATAPASQPPPPPSPASPPPPPPMQAWTPVGDVNDMSIRQVGQFAVRIYALTMRVDLAFVGVVGGQTQPRVDGAGGFMYQLVVAVAGTGAKAPTYDALVWGVLGTRNWELRSFKPK